jgi:hypothetical protein
MYSSDDCHDQTFEVGPHSALCVSYCTFLTSEFVRCFISEADPLSILSGNSLCDLVVRVPGYRTEVYCASCEVLTGFMYVM